MFLQDKKSSVLVKVLNLEELFDPMQEEISGQIQDGQEEQDPAPMPKQHLVFPSGESLPQCWLDKDYRSH
ncbi:acetyltransferase [Leptolyngbya sp. AN02str]|uniref:acetyltransferase n=1 Tax=Leptolyngbya sp. AN02str TaxID=3423363 RepID=UPI003D3196A2